MLYICRFKKRPLISNQHKYCSTAVWYFCLCLLRNTEETCRNCGKRKIRMKVGDSCSLWLVFFFSLWGGGWEVTHTPTRPTTIIPSLLPWLVSMCRAQGLGNECRPGCAPSLKPARNARPLFFPPLSRSLLFRRPAALAAICSSEIFPPLRSLCIGEPDVIG